MKKGPLTARNLRERLMLRIHPGLVKNASTQTATNRPGDQRHARQLAEVFLRQPLAAHPGGNHRDRLHNSANLSEKADRDFHPLRGSAILSNRTTKNDPSVWFGELRDRRCRELEAANGAFNRRSDRDDEIGPRHQPGKQVLLPFHIVIKIPGPQGPPTRCSRRAT